MGVQQDVCTPRWVHSKMGVRQNVCTAKWVHSKMGVQLDGCTERGVHIRSGAYFHGPNEKEITSTIHKHYFNISYFYYIKLEYYPANRLCWQRGGATMSIVEDEDSSDGDGGDCW